MIRDKAQKLTDQLLEIADGADVTAQNLAAMTDRLGDAEAELGKVTAERDKLLKDVADLTAERDALNQRAVSHEAKCIAHEAKISEYDGLIAEERRQKEDVLARFAPEIKAEQDANIQQQIAALQAQLESRKA